MNKSLILVLAVCLVSVHAFVKRDAPPADKPTDMDAFVNKVKEAGNKISEALKPESIKKAWDETVSSVSKAFDLKPKEQPQS